MDELFLALTLVGIGIIAYVFRRKSLDELKKNRKKKEEE